MKNLFLVCICLLLASCFEVIEEVSFNKDGSGTITITANFSESKTEIESARTMDSFKGKKIPNEPEIIAYLKELKNTLNNIEGIKMADYNIDFTEYIVSVTCQFAHTQSLNHATQIIANKINKNWSIETPLYSKSKNKFTREDPIKSITSQNNIRKEIKALLADARYTLIYRFKQEIIEASNPKVRISKNRKASMIKTNILDWINHKTTIENTIILKD